MADVKGKGAYNYDAVYKTYNTATDRWTKQRDESYKDATTFGIGPIRLPRGPFSNNKAIQDAQERFAKLQDALNSAMDMLKEATVSITPNSN
jgi:hypothetical protein